MTAAAVRWWSLPPFRSYVSLLRMVVRDWLEDHLLLFLPDRVIRQVRREREKIQDHAVTADWVQTILDEHEQQRRRER